MGIANPVTRETCGSGTQYHMQLAKQLAGILQAPLEVKTKPEWSLSVVLNYLRVIRNLNKSLTPFTVWLLFNQHVIFCSGIKLVGFFFFLSKSKLFSIPISDICNFLNLFDIKFFFSPVFERKHMISRCLHIFLYI